MRTYRPLLLMVLLVCLLLIGVGEASAHSGEPLKSIKARIGPYPVTIHYYTDPEGGQPLVFTIVPDQPDATLQYQVTAVPGPTLQADVVAALLEPDSDALGAVQGTVQLPASGEWLLSIEMDGSFGHGAGSAPVLIHTPPGMPLWMGWLIGLMPILSLLSFLVYQARRAPPLPSLAGATGA